MVVSGLAAIAARADGTPPEADGGYSANQLKRHEAFDHADRPAWGVEFAGSPLAFGGHGLAPANPQAENIPLTLQVEWQPVWIQKFGTIGLGPVLGAYPIGSNQGLTNSFISIWSIGAEARYQARYSNHQILVPSIGYEVDRLAYSFVSGQNGAVTLKGPTAGLEFSLNAIDEMRGEEFYESTGISHTYLVGEVRDLTGGDGTVGTQGLSWYLGLRFEL